MKPSVVTCKGSVPAVVHLVIACMLLGGCASPIPNLWPPPSDASARTIYVSLDTWHAMIAFPIQQEAISDQPSALSFMEGSPTHNSALRTQDSFEEWGYAERAWYLEGRTGFTGILRALFWPTEGVVEVGQYDQVWADRTPQPPSDLFLFRVSEEGYRRLRRHLQSTIAGADLVTATGRATFYPAVRSYHLLHTCHQYAASALREAGLPISVFWAFNRTSLAWQLRRAERLATERATHSGQDAR